MCKLLNFVPRHQLIVARILGEEHSIIFTRLIGFSEVMMVVWILSKVKSRWCSISQIIIVITMNIIEFILAPDLLLFGRLNLMIAFLFVVIVFINEFILQTKLKQLENTEP